MLYKVFVRNWWRENPSWPNGLEPNGGARKTTLGYVDSEDEARGMCAAYRAKHEPGRLSRKAEYESVRPSGRSRVR